MQRIPVLYMSFILRTYSLVVDLFKKCLQLKIHSTHINRDHSAWCVWISAHTIHINGITLEISVTNFLRANSQGQDPILPVFYEVALRVYLLREQLLFMSVRSRPSCPTTPPFPECAFTWLASGSVTFHTQTLSGQHPWLVFFSETS